MPERISSLLRPFQIQNIPSIKDKATKSQNILIPWFVLLLLHLRWGLGKFRADKTLCVHLPVPRTVWLQPTRTQSWHELRLVLRTWIFRRVSPPSGANTVDLRSFVIRPPGDGSQGIWQSRKKTARSDNMLRWNNGGTWIECERGD